MYRLPFGRLSMIISPSSRSRAEVVLLEVGWRMAHGCCLSAAAAAAAVAVVGRAATTVTTQTTAAAKRGGEERAEECGRLRAGGGTTCVMMPSCRPTDEDGFLVPALPLAPLVTGFEEVVP